MSRLIRDGTAKSVSRNQIFRRELGQGNFPWSADHVNWIGNLPVALYSAIYNDNNNKTCQYSSSSTNILYLNILHRSGCGENIWMPPWTSEAIP